jgi:hypothetical protein
MNQNLEDEVIKQISKGERLIDCYKYQEARRVLIKITSILFMKKDLRSNFYPILISRIQDIKEYLSEIDKSELSTQSNKDLDKLISLLDGLIKQSQIIPPILEEEKGLVNKSEIRTLDNTDSIIYYENDGDNGAQFDGWLILNSRDYEQPSTVHYECYSSLESFKGDLNTKEHVESYCVDLAAPNQVELKRAFETAYSGRKRPVNPEQAVH